MGVRSAEPALRGSGRGFSRRSRTKYAITLSAEIMTRAPSGSLAMNCRTTASSTTTALAGPANRFTTSMVAFGLTKYPNAAAMRQYAIMHPSRWNGGFIRQLRSAFRAALLEQHTAHHEHSDGDGGVLKQAAAECGRKHQEQP